MQKSWCQSLSAFSIKLTYSSMKQSQADKDSRRRQRLLDEIQMEAKLTENYTGRSTFSTKVMEAIANTPRHEFIGPHQQELAYINAPLPIGHGQTISQPYIVALMTELLEVDTSHRILEIGTGCGYQTAVLSQLVDRVFTIEIIKELSVEAEKRFRKLNYSNIDLHIGDGYLGWEEQAPFDRIIVTAAAGIIPPALTEQLKPDGHLVIPVGHLLGGQELKLIYKTPDNQIEEHTILPVAFVPLTRN